MKIAQKYSHLNGEEYLIVHHKKLYDEIIQVIESIDAEKLRTKISKEKKKVGSALLSPIDLNKAFNDAFYKKDWNESRYNYYITLDRELMEQSIPMSAKEQKEFLIENGEENPIYSYNQTDFVKDKIAVEVQFGKYAFVAFDLFVKYKLFLSNLRPIDVFSYILLYRLDTLPFFFIITKECKSINRKRIHTYIILTFCKVSCKIYHGQK